ncbi:DUF421 domain-containing protein [Hymenobacter sp. NBH84]|uniref:DUF421 domain-containing protein n=1 Tax=Hymenobacter sp. NBH84 TaxID=2596915 RepID=UPI001629A403|nr:YetF domain-containing protein [Hymenobacter sp. NBH84]QNE40171.1 DUF421 domain-containing protein [Hymenobacter sp. NBH84]
MEQITPFDWHRMLWSEDAPPAFLWEVVLRCVITYLLVLGALRVTGRRGVRQLSIFELSIILALGSAGGDAMFYQDVPLLHVAVVFVVVPTLYLIFNRITEKSVKFSNWLEGATICLIEDGVIDIEEFRKHNLTYKELFGELRQRQVEHLGQVRKMYMEATGEISVFFYPTTEPVRPGLPIWPEVLKTAQAHVTEPGSYACTECGRVVELPAATSVCTGCHQNCWVPACTRQRET